MSSIFLFDIASQRSNWLSIRQAAISGNIANANTPGYDSRDVAPFERVLQTSQLELAKSDPGHFGLANELSANMEPSPEDEWHVYHSGNSVSIEKEMVKASEVNSAFSLNGGVVKAFHRMLIASTKG